MADKEGAARPDLRTRFEPGRSGNPGGRPAADQVVRRLASKRAWRALAVLVSALDDGAELIVIDARGLGAELGFDRERGGLLADGYDVALEPLNRELVEFRARGVRRRQLEEIFEADWVAADMQLQAESGQPYTCHGRRHITSGEWVGWWPWCKMREEFAVRRMGLEAIGATIVPSAGATAEPPIGVVEL